MNRETIKTIKYNDDDDDVRENKKLHRKKEGEKLSHFQIEKLFCTAALWKKVNLRCDGIKKKSWMAIWTDHKEKSSCCLLTLTAERIVISIEQ
jgi:hypothetical protein